MTEFTVLNMQTEATTGWAARAMQRGLRISSASGRFGDEIYLVKNGSGNFVKLTQNTQRGCKLDTTGFSVGQVAIVQILQDCGLLRRMKSPTAKPEL